MDSIHVRALFFASYRELVGSSATDVRLSKAASVADLVRAVRNRGAPWDALPERPAIAVNLEYAPDHRILHDGDEVAFVPPVAGG